MDLEHLDHDDEREARLKFDIASASGLSSTTTFVLFYATSENQESLSGRDR